MSIAKFSDQTYREAASMWLEAAARAEQDKSPVANYFRSKASACLRAAAMVEPSA